MCFSEPRQDQAVSHLGAVAISFWPGSCALASLVQHQLKKDVCTHRAELGKKRCVRTIENPGWLGTELLVMTGVLG